MSEIQGLYITVTGRFYGYSIYEVQAALEARGAHIDQKLSKRTRYCFMGKGSVRYEVARRAHLLGTTVVGHDQTLAFLKGEPLEQVLEWEPEAPEPDLDADEALAALRESLSLESREDAWDQLCADLDQIPPDRAAVAVDYVLAHTASWPYQVDLFESYPLSYTLGALPSRWVPLLLQGKDEPKLGVVRSLSLPRQKLPASYLRPMSKCHHLRQVRYLDLSHNRLSRTTFPALCGSPLFEELRFLNLSGIEGGAGMWRNDTVSALKDWLLLPSLGSLEALCLSEGPLLSWVGSPALAHLSSLTRLRLDVGVYALEDLQRLVHAPHLAGLVELHLNFRLPSQELCSFLLEMPLPLRSLGLVCVDNLGLKSIAENPRLHSVEELSLYNSQISPKGLCTFLRRMPALRRVQVRTTHLSEIAMLRKEAEARGIEINL